MLTIMGIAARRKEIDLQGTKVKVAKIMSTDSPRRVSRLEVIFEVPLPPDHPDRSFLESAALSCPVHHSLHADIEKPVDFRWQG